MNYNKEQQLEIETIKARTIKLNLSDADCERIAELSGSYGLTVAQLLENFIGDLVDGTYSNGSDERMYANQWFERCGFAMFPEKTLLKYLLDYGLDVDDFLTVYDELKYYEENPKEYTEALEEAIGNGEERPWFEEEYHDYIDEFLNNHENVDIEKEIKICREWLVELQSIKGNS